MMLAALLLGMAGSLHCAGMCSPLVLAVSAKQGQAFLRRVVYNAGRILTYGVLGGIVATAGYMVPFQRFQNSISIALGIALLVVALAGTQYAQLPGVTRLINPIILHIKKLFQVYLAKKGHGSTLMLGMLNGLLPCGLTLLALTSCLAAPSPVRGVFFMIVFGAGTLPVMLGLTSLLGIALENYKLNFRKLTTGLLILSGLLLITRTLWQHQHAAAAEPVSTEIVICR